MQYRDLDARIEGRLEQLTNMRSLAERCTTTLSGLPRGGNQREDLYAKMIDEGRLLGADIDRLIHLRGEIESVIASVPDGVHRTLLSLRYLSKMTWEQVAECMERDPVTIWRLHRKALSTLSLPSSIA